MSARITRSYLGRLFWVLPLLALAIRRSSSPATLKKSYIFCFYAVKLFLQSYYDPLIIRYKFARFPGRALALLRLFNSCGRLSRWFFNWRGCSIRQYSPIFRPFFSAPCTLRMKERLGGA